MANQLKMALQHSIITLVRQGWSFRRVARTLGVHRETVARYVRLDAEAEAEPGRAKPAISITGSDAMAPAHSITGVGPPGTSREGDDATPAISTIGSAGRRSQCEPFRDIIIEMLERGLSAQRIWQDLTAEHGFADSYQSVRRFVCKLRTRTPLPFRRIESVSGVEAQWTSARRRR